MKKSVKKIIYFSVAHALLSFICVIVALDFSAIDTGVAEKDLLSDIAGIIGSILLSPGRFLWNSWASNNLPNILEWFVFIGNSVLWGIILAFVYDKLRKIAT